MARPTILVLDDEPYRIDVLRELFAPHGVYGTKAVDDFVRKAAYGGWSMLFFDHDLSPVATDPNGADAARQLAEAGGAAYRACAHVPVVVHSLNMERCADIVQALASWEAPVVRVPFHRVPEYVPWLRRLFEG